MDESSKDPRSVRLIEGMAALLGVAVFVVGPIAGSEYRWPPDFKPGWLLSWVLSIFATAVSLISVRLRPSGQNRVVFTIVIALALIGTWFPLDCYYRSYFTYPWIVVGGLGAMTVVGGWICRLRFLVVASFAFLLFWFAPAFLPPAKDLPIAQTQGRLECKLVSTNEGSCNFRLRDPGGGDLSWSYDLEDLRLEGGIGALMEVRCWSARSFGPEGYYHHPSGREVEFHSTIFPPHWARSFDLRISVYPLQPKPLASIVVPLDGSAAGVQSPSGAYRLSASMFGWGSSSSRYPAVRCFKMSIASTGRWASGRVAGEYRFTDDLGHPVEWSTADFGSTNGDEETGGIEVFSINPKAKTLRIELLGDEPTPIVFSFPRVPVSD